jgi:hypothetical protein
MFAAVRKPLLLAVIVTGWRWIGCRHQQQAGCDQQ